jgi:hypothetical protein
MADLDFLPNTSVKKEENSSREFQAGRTSSTRSGHMLEKSQFTLYFIINTISHTTPRLGREGGS